MGDQYERVRDGFDGHVAAVVLGHPRAGEVSQSFAMLAVVALALVGLNPEQRARATMSTATPI